MKHFLFSTVLMIMIFSCSKLKKSSSIKKPASTTAVVLLVDVTDPQFTVVDASSIKKYYGIVDDNSQGGMFRGKILSDVRYNAIYECKIEPKSFLLSNPGERKKDVAKFLSDVDSYIEIIKGYPVGKPQSNLFSVIAEEANWLARQNVSSKHIFCYSNLFEHSQLFDLYSKQALAQLDSSSEEIQYVFEQSIAFEHLHGITMHIIFQAQDFEEDKKFAPMAGIYKTIFEKNGAEVIITGN